jgi:hypothetical protein
VVKFVGWVVVIEIVGLLFPLFILFDCWLLEFMLTVGDVVLVLVLII